MASRSRPSVLTPDAVAALVALACLAALAQAAIEAGGTITLTPAESPTGSRLFGLGIMALGLLGIVTFAVTRFRRPVLQRARRGDETELRLDSVEVRTLLERWYPDWDDRHRARVARAISYHRRRRGQGD